VKKTEKVQKLEEVKALLSTAQLVVVTRQSGMSVAESSDLRVQIRAAQARYKVAKNRLVKLAIADTQFSGLAQLLTGPTALAVSEDPVAAAKTIVKFAKSNDKIEVIGGVLNGNVLDAAGIKALAELPSLDELRGKLVGVLQAPAGKVASVLQAPAGQLARVFGAYGNKDAA